MTKDLKRSRLDARGAKKWGSGQIRYKQERMRGQREGGVQNWGEGRPRRTVGGGRSRPETKHQAEQKKKAHETWSPGLVPKCIRDGTDVRRGRGETGNGDVTRRRMAATSHMRWVGNVGRAMEWTPGPPPEGQR
jgi:hypothetical protein